MTLTLVPLPGRPHDWDARIAAYDTKSLFHEGAWLDHALSIHPGSRIDYAEIRRDGALVGYFCAHRITKLMLPVYGSPLPGTGTNYMGPVVNRGEVDQRELLAAVASFVRRRAAHLELAADFVDEEAALAGGFEVHRSVTHLVPLAPTVEGTWDGLKSPCRNRVKKAEKNGLVAEVTSDPAIVEHFFAQFIEVYAKQGMDVPFQVDRPRSLFAHLHPAGRLLPVWVRNGDDVIAAGLFPFDDRAIYFWGAASWLRAQPLSPNELLHWTVMKEAVARGIPAYNMCGGTSQFKDKFGGADVPYNQYSRSFVPMLGKARDVYKSLHHARLRLAGKLKGKAAERPAAPAAPEGAKEQAPTDAA